jgi:Zn-dependent protease
MDAEQLRQMLISAPGLILSLTIHEVAHARTALAFGDPTARDLGRTSLNPLRHLDPIGTLALFFAGFGWAKPVPVNPNNLDPPRAGDFAVSLAGPLSNFGLAIVFALIYRGLHMLVVSPRFHALASSQAFDWLLIAVWITVRINIVLCVFNLMPIYPLDGHHMLREVLPPHMHYGYMHWQMRYGMIVLIAIVLLPRLMLLSGHEGFVSPIWYVQEKGFELLKPLMGLH